MLSASLNKATPSFQYIHSETLLNLTIKGPSTKSGFESFQLYIFREVCVTQVILTGPWFILSFKGILLFEGLVYSFHCMPQPAQCLYSKHRSMFYTWLKEGNVLFNDALNTFYLRLYGVWHMVKDHSDSERGNPLLPHGLLFLISSKGSFICIIPQTG